jgi:hypothetical protein
MHNIKIDLRKTAYEDLWSVVNVVMKEGYYALECDKGWSGRSLTDVSEEPVKFIRSQDSQHGDPLSIPDQLIWDLRSIK